MESLRDDRPSYCIRMKITEVTNNMLVLSKMFYKGWWGRKNRPTSKTLWTWKEKCNCGGVYFPKQSLLVFVPHLVSSYNNVIHNQSYRGPPCWSTPTNQTNEPNRTDACIRRRVLHFTSLQYRPSSLQICWHTTTLTPWVTAHVHLCTNVLSVRKTSFGGSE